MNKSTKLYNGTQKVKQRRLVVISRLELQLKSGVKPFSNKQLDRENIIYDDNAMTTLEQNDIIRIKKEIEILKKRV